MEWFRRGKQSSDRVDRRRLERALAPFEPESVYALIEAATASPMASHRIPSLALLLEEALKNPPKGRNKADATDLEELLRAAREADPTLAWGEDFVPADPRRPVLARWRRGLYRLVPGELERPIAVLERAQLVGDVVDNVLIKRLGFGVGDLVELVLVRMDQVVQALAHAWPSDPQPGPHGEATVTENEVLAAMATLGIQSAIPLCSFPDRARQALKWATVNAKDLTFSLKDMDAAFGSTLAVRYKDGRIQGLPVAMCFESLNYAVRILAERAIEFEPTLEKAFENKVDRVVRHLLSLTHGEVCGPISDQSRRLLHSLVIYSKRAGLLVHVVAGLSPTRSEEALEPAVEQLMGIQPGMVVRTPTGSLKIPAGARLVKALVLALPAHAVLPQIPGIATMTLDDLSWIISTGTTEPTDLLSFCDDYARLGVGQMFSMETINAYEHWRENDKCFHRAGRPLQAMLLELHRGDSEWYRAADRARLEKALLFAGLERASTWELIDMSPPGDDAKVGRLSPAEAWHISFSPTVAARVFDDLTPSQLYEFAGKLVNGFLWKLRRTGPIAQEMIDRVRPSGGLRVIFKHAQPVDGVPPIRLVRAYEGELVVEWDERTREVGLGDSTQIEAMMGAALVTGINQMTNSQILPVTERFAEAWSKAPPGIRFDAKRIPQQLVDVPSPTESSKAERARFQRTLAERLAAKGIEPGRYDREQSRQLESEAVYPILLELLHETMTPFCQDGMLHIAARQLESAFSKRFQKEWELGWNQGFPVVDFNPVDVAMRDRETDVRLSRTLSLIVEEVLFQPPKGTLVPDRLEWEKILAIAELCLESGTRSESIHYGLSPVEVEISGVYEVNLKLANGSPSIDEQAFKEASIKATMPRFPGQQEEGDSDSGQDQRTFLEQFPKLKGIDHELRASKGFGLEALTGVLDVLRGWPVGNQSPAVEAPPEDVERWCGNHLEYVPVHEIRGAIRELSLRGEDLEGPILEHWEFDRRRVRLVTRPLIAAPSGNLIVMPWTIEGTLRVFANYLSDGRLPWPSSSLDRRLVQTLRDYRAEQNTQLEKDILRELREAGYKALGGVKKPKVLNLTNSVWHGEIDAIAMDEKKGVLWVIEAKDPYATFSPAQVHRLIGDFHEEDGYVDKLLRKAESVRSNPGAVSRALGYKGEEQDWVVKPLMVTRRPEAAAFVQQPRVPFCTLSYLLETVQSDS